MFANLGGSSKGFSVACQQHFKAFYRTKGVEDSKETLLIVETAPLDTPSLEHNSAQAAPFLELVEWDEA
jgi:hypothetical protein